MEFLIKKFRNHYKNFQNGFARSLFIVIYSFQSLI